MQLDVNMEALDVCLIVLKQSKKAYKNQMKSIIEDEEDEYHNNVIENLIIGTEYGINLLNKIREETLNLNEED